jgi:hypothetical protein
LFPPLFSAKTLKVEAKDKKKSVIYLDEVTLAQGSLSNREGQKLPSVLEDE